MSTTENFDLIKLSLDDSADITTLNSNWDKIDEQLAIANKTFVANSTDGVNYTATVEGITELYNGLTITIVPTLTSTNSQIKLNVNNLGSKAVKLAASTSTKVTAYPSRSTFYMKDAPITLMYNTSTSTSGEWVVKGKDIISTSDLQGTVSLSKGGTGIPATTDDSVGAFFVTKTKTALQGNYGVLPVEMGGTGSATKDAARVNLEVAPAVESSDHKGCYYRVVNDETEWINPPMIDGEVYRTTKRCNGKPVYAQFKTVGALPNTTETSVAMGSSENDVVDQYVNFEFFATNTTADDRKRYEFPFINDTGAVVGQIRFIGNRSFKIITRTDLSSYVGSYIVEYTLQ